MKRLFRPSAAQMQTFGVLFAVSVLGFSGAYSLFYSLTSPERLQQIAAQTAAGTGRKITFDGKQISRTLFPRPTVTLHNIAISAPNGAQTEVRIEEMRLGMAWKSLLGSEEIEKWVFIRPDVRISVDENGRFGLEDLLTADSSRLPVNRLFVEQGYINVQTPEYSYSLPSLDMKLHGVSAAQTRMEAEGSFKSGGNTLTQWHTRSTVLKNRNEWQFPDFTAEIGGEWAKIPFGLTMDGQLGFQTDTRRLNIKPLNLQASLPQYETHISAAVPNGSAHNGALTLPEISAVLTSSYRQAQWNGTLSLTRVRLRPTVAGIDKLAFSGSRKDGKTDINATLAGQLNWQQTQGWELAELTFGSRVENTLGERQTRFHTEMTGNFRYAPDGAWQGRLHGLLDRQNAALEAAYTPANESEAAELSGKAAFTALNLNPYLANVADGKSPFSDGLMPLQLLKQGRLKIDAGLSAKTLQWENVAFDNLESRLSADREAVRLPDFRAELYGGRSSGSIEIGLSEPLSYRIRQTAEDVQVRPLLQDLFRVGLVGGQGRADFDLESRGATREEWIKNLKGRLNLNLRHGALWGLDLHHALSERKHTKNEERFTPFTRFIVENTLQNGIAAHQNAQLFSDTLNFTSEGSVDFNTLTIKDKTKLFPHKSSGMPVPIDIRGPLDNPSVTVDYSGLTEGLDSAEAKQQAVTEALKAQWQWLKPKSSGKSKEKTE